MRRSDFMKALLTLALLASLASAALAQSLILPGELTATDPTFNRAQSLVELSQVGTASAYDLYAFEVSVSGTYTAELSTPAPLDGYLFVYADAFDPASALTNLINGDDDYTGAFTVLPGSSAANLRGSRIAIGEGNNYAPGGLTLTAGTTYFAVASAFDNASLATGRGAYTLGIGGGPGAVTLVNPVPEPASMAALGLGALAMLRRRRKA